MSIPKKHHFMPEFFLKRWCNPETKKLVYFHKPHELKLVDNERFPSQVGFEKFLYSIKNLPVDQAQEIEINFFSKIDDQASNALNSLDKGTNISTELEVHWWRFVATLITRMPSDLKKVISFNDTISTSFLPIFAKVSSIAEFNGKKEEIEQALIEIRRQRKDNTIHYLTKIMNNDRLLQKLQSFHWTIISTAGAKHELLTSDRPAHISKEDNATFVLIPIGPQRLFIASDREIISSYISRTNVKQLVAQLNKLTAGNATEYVFARTNLQKPFIEKHMGSLNDSSFIDTFIEAASAEFPAMEDALNDEFERLISDF